MSDFRWLIEAPGSRYLAARKLGNHEFHWTQDHNEAIAFRNEAQADITMMAIRNMDRQINGFDKGLFAFEANLGNARAVEHGWMASLVPHGGPTEANPNRPYCKPDQSCCDFCCGN